jgi:squalene-hopene/tetraprenyl-beta-curcumene cyclase
MKKLTVVALLSLFLGLTASAFAADEAKPNPPDAKAYGQAVEKAIEYLTTKGQAADGSFTAPAGPGVTAIVVTGILSQGRSPDDPVVEKALKYLEKFIQPDGGIYEPKNFYKNYETCLGLMAFSAANKQGKNEKFAKIVKDAEKFLKEIQWDERQSQDQASAYYGGAGYGKSKRPDLSNTQFLLDALKTAGAGPDDPAVKKALIFVSRCQNLETENNTLPFASKNPDGGFYYTPAAGGTSQAGPPLPGGGLRSYGSMTYAGLKSMIYAGVGPDDARVKAAYKWIQQNYDLKSNPGMSKPEEGLYYYYHTFAKALDAVGKPELVDAKGVKHDWRKELSAELISRQKANGSWANDADRWMEGDPNLVTAYSLLALSYCRTAGQQ